MSHEGTPAARARRRWPAVWSVAALVAAFSAAATVSGGEPRDTVTVPIRDGDDAVSAAFRLGVDQGQGQITVGLDDGSTHAFRVGIESEKAQRMAEKDRRSVLEPAELPDAILSLSGLVRYYSRPRLQRYTAEQQEDRMARWNAFPAASQRFVTFEARQDETGVGIYLDGLYAGRRDAKGRLKSLEFDLPREGEVRGQSSCRHYRDPRFLPLSTRAIARPGVMGEATVSPEPGWQSLGGIPMLVAAGSESVDVGVVKQMKGSWALECDEHLARTAFDGMPETAHFSVPQACYTRAWVLCAVDPDPGREPILTARLTRFATSGRGDAIADTSLSLPRGPDDRVPGVTEIGSVRYTKAGQRTEVPLYLVEFALKPGEILDLLSMEKDSWASMSAEPYLDFEFLGRLGEVTAQWDLRHKPDNQSTSAVHVFGVTLERSPVELLLHKGQPGNIFHNEEEPRMGATLKARWPCRVTLVWRICDTAGRTLRQERERLSFDLPGALKEVPIPLRMSVLGWYGVDFTLTDDDGRELLRHSASFAQLGKDTRQAGYESPYGTWWFAEAHYGVGDKEIAGPMLFKAGLRRTTFAWSQYSEADMAPWKVTLNQLSWQLAPQDMAHPERAYAEAEARVRQQLERFPHCRAADIFHESYAHYVPAELRGEPSAEDGETARRGEERAALGTFAARFYRERFPDVWLLVGNTSSSASIVASLFRHGFDPRYIDYIGVEAVGQTGMPEKLWEGSTQGTWLAREVARRFGHDLPVTGCFEFTARTDRNLGPRRQAEWIVRDMLLCHAYRFQHINPAIIHDAGNAYFNTLWGGGGLCRRNPLLYPKPAYVAVATLTKVLDQVRPQRRVDTGSTTVFAYEFGRADGQLVYALWTARGDALLRLQYPRRTEVTEVGCYGEQRQARTRLGRDDLDVHCGTAPTYVVCPAPPDTFRVVRRVLTAPPAGFRVASRMDQLEPWRLQNDEPGLAGVSDPDTRGLPIRVPGDFAWTRVVDREQGPCIELTLKRQGELADIVSEYTVLRLREPVPVPGTPRTIGVWVKGDSGWGQIVFEIQDAGGVLWRTEGDWHDWPGDLSICHDGWCFMGFPIDGSSKLRNISPSPRWNRESATPGDTIRFPIRIAGLGVVMNRRALDLADMKEVRGVLRLRDFGTSAEDAVAAE